jgi:hypothetical protein
MRCSRFSWIALVALVVLNALCGRLWQGCAPVMVAQNNINQIETIQETFHEIPPQSVICKFIV